MIFHMCFPAQAMGKMNNANGCSLLMAVIARCIYFVRRKCFLCRKNYFFCVDFLRLTAFSQPTYDWWVDCCVLSTEGTTDCVLQVMSNRATQSTLWIRIRRQQQLWERVHNRVVHHSTKLSALNTEIIITVVYGPPFFCCCSSISERELCRWPIVHIVSLSYACMSTIGHSVHVLVSMCECVFKEWTEDIWYSMQHISA